MQKLEQMINIYHTAFIIFLVLTILFLLLSVFLFFKLNIREIYDLRTGRGARRKIQEMEEINERTGKLREDVVYENYNMSNYDLMPQSKSEPLQEVRHTVTYQDQGNVGLSVKQSQAMEAVEGGEDTTLLNDESETSLLSDDSETTMLNDESETTLLNGDLQTSLLSGESKTLILGHSEELENSQLENCKAKEEKKETVGKFNIEKEVMLIHTDEIL